MSDERKREIREWITVCRKFAQAWNVAREKSEATGSKNIELPPGLIKRYMDVMKYASRTEVERLYSLYVQSYDNEFCIGAAAEDLESEIVKLRPDAKRGRKILKAAAKGGRNAARQYHEPIREQYRAALVEYMQRNKNVSLTAARERIAARFGVSRRTLENHTRDFSRK